MATLAARGSGTPATTGTTWATVTNAVDGAAGTNPATYATATNAVASAVQTIEITGYGFSSSIASTDTLNSVTVSLRHFENNTARFTSVTFQAFDGATAIGTATTCTLATAARNDTATPAVTLAQLRSSTFKIRVTVTGAASTQSRIESIDYVDVTADYTPTPPAITQAAYRIYADGTETGSTALAAQDTAPTVDTTDSDANIQIRARLQSTTAIAVPATDDWQLQWEKNTSGTWGNVTTPTTLADGYTDTFADADAAIWNAGIATDTSRRGQSFLGNGERLVQAGFHLRRLNTPTGTITAELYAHTGTFGTTGIPTGSPLTTSTTALTVASISTTNDWYYFDFDRTFTLTNGTPYVIVLTASVATGDSLNHNIKVRRDISTPTHPGLATHFVSGAWVAQSAADTVFALYTGPAVAPTTVVAYATPNLTDAAATTNRLTAGTGSFVAGKVSEDGLADNAGWSANNHTELLYSITLKQADLALGDTLRFRILRNGVTTGLTYTQVPTVTIGTSAYTRYRTFDGIDDKIDWTLGNIAGNPSVPHTIVFVIRNIAHVGDAEVLAAPGFDPLDIFYVDGGTTIAYYDGVGFANGPSWPSGSDWCLFAFRSVTASSSIWSRSLYNGTSWPTPTHTTTGVTLANRTWPASGNLTIGNTGGLVFDCVLFARFNTNLTDAQINAMTAGVGAIQTTPGITNLWKLSQVTPTDLFGTTTATVTGTTRSVGYSPFLDAAPPGGGPTDRTGQAVGTITLGSSTSGVRGRPGVATATLTLTGTSSGVGATPGVNVTGTATGTLALAGSSTATRGTTATTTGALSLSGVATGLKVVRGAGTASLALDGHTAATRGITGTAAATTTLTGTGAGTVTAGGTAVVGTATGNLTLTAATLGTRTTTGTATGQLTLGSTSTGVRTTRGTATGQATLTSLALGLVEGNAVGRALATITLTSTGLGTRGRPGTALGQATLTGQATARRHVTATLTAHLTLTGTARAAGITTTPIHGQWNNQTFDAMQYGDKQIVDWHMQPA